MKPRRATWGLGRTLACALAMAAGLILHAENAEPQLTAKLAMTFKLMGGEMRVTGQSADLADYSGELVVTVKSVELGELVKFVDAVTARVAKAEGRLSGEMKLRLLNGELAAIGPGKFALDAGTKARLTLRPMPGLFSAYMPAAVRKTYPGLDALEAGRTPLEATVLELEIMDKADAEGRIGRLSIEGKPVDVTLVAPLALTFNFRGEVVEAVREFLRLKLRLSGQ